MNIVFTDLFKQECQDKFQISKEHAKQALRNPDSQQIIEIDNLELVFYVKRETRPEGETYLLVCTQRKDNNLLVGLSFRILPDLISGIKALEPIIVLQQFAQRFGLTIRIGHQLNKFIFRELIPCEQQYNTSTNLVEIINPSKHNFQQSMFIKVEQRGKTKVINCALAYCIDTDEYLAWLHGKSAQEEDALVDIAPRIRGYVTPRDLITASGTISFVTNYSELGGNRAGFLFRLISNVYSLEVGFTATHFYIARNDQRLKVPIDPVYKPTGKVRCFAIWEPTQLSLILLDESYVEAVSSMSDPTEEEKEFARRTKTLPTPETFPPNSLIAWARGKAIAPVITYSSVQHFYETVVSSLQSVIDKVLTLEPLPIFKTKNRLL